MQLNPFLSPPRALFVS